MGGRQLFFFHVAMQRVPVKNFINALLSILCGIQQQALCADKGHGLSEFQQRDAKFPHAREDLGTGLGMYRGKDHMSAECRTYDHVGGLHAAHLAEHDDIGIVTQQFPYPDFISKTAFLVDLKLHIAAVGDLNGILQCDHLQVMLQGCFTHQRVQCRRFPAPGGSAEQGKPVPLPAQRMEKPAFVLILADFLDPGQFP